MRETPKIDATPIQVSGTVSWSKARIGDSTVRCRPARNPVNHNAQLKSPANEDSATYGNTDFRDENRDKLDDLKNLRRSKSGSFCGITKAVGIIHVRARIRQQNPQNAGIKGSQLLSQVQERSQQRVFFIRSDGSKVD